MNPCIHVLRNSLLSLALLGTISGPTTATLIGQARKHRKRPPGSGAPSASPLQCRVLAEVFRDVDVTRIRGGARSIDVDRAATEEPLEVRLHSRSFAVIMRTPGADRDLAAGFLLAEGVLKSADDFGIIEYCTDPKAAHPENIAGIPIVAAVSAPSSLAIELAEDCRMTLIGFLRGTTFNIYSHPERIVS